METTLCAETLERENAAFRDTGGRSEENRDRGFVPAFIDTETETIYRSCFANGLPAPFHSIDGLPGEVVVDYAVRLKREFDASRLWITAYANDTPCYIPSERVLKEGGYEGREAMVIYGLPTAWGARVEELIVAEALEQANRLRQ